MDQSHSLQPPARLSIPPVVGYNSEDDQVQEVDQEVETKHSSSKHLPLGLQQATQRLRLEHVVAVLRGEKADV